MTFPSIVSVEEVEARMHVMLVQWLIFLFQDNVFKCIKVIVKIFLLKYKFDDDIRYSVIKGLICINVCPLLVILLLFNLT